MPKKQKLSTDIAVPEENDILLGRGGAAINNNANIR